MPMAHPCIHQRELSEKGARFFPVLVKSAEYPHHSGPTPAAPWRGRVAMASRPFQTPVGGRPRRRNPVAENQQYRERRRLGLLGKYMPMRRLEDGGDDVARGVVGVRAARRIAVGGIRIIALV